MLPQVQRINGENLWVRPFQVLCNHCVRLQSSVPSTVPFRKKLLALSRLKDINPLENIVMALKWLSWVYHQTGNRILHALNGGEQRIDGNFVDGYDPQRKTIYEFMGCMWHGCDNQSINQSITFI